MPGGLRRPPSAGRVSARTPRRPSRGKTWSLAGGFALFVCVLLFLRLRRGSAAAAAAAVATVAATEGAGAGSGARLAPPFAGVDVTMRGGAAFLEDAEINPKGGAGAAGGASLDGVEGSEGELVELAREATAAGAAGGGDAGEGAAKGAAEGASGASSGSASAGGSGAVSGHGDAIVGSRALDPGHSLHASVEARAAGAQASSSDSAVARAALERARARAAPKTRASLDAIALATGGRVSAYDPPIPLVDASGRRFTTERFKGRVLLVVNVASQCGYTESNYAGLARLSQRYRQHGLEVLAFPCDQFGHQEPDDAESVQETMRRRFPGADFVYAAKGDVNGPHESELFAFLKRATPNADGVLEFKDISWNFNKFLLDRDGIPVRRYTSSLDYNQLERDVYELLVEGTKDA